MFHYYFLIKNNQYITKLQFMHLLVQHNFHYLVDRKRYLKFSEYPEMGATMKSLVAIQSCFFFIVFVLLGNSVAVQTQYGVAVSRIERLRRGYNASIPYFGKYDESTYRNLKEKGYDHVRVTMKPNDVYNSNEGSAKSSGVSMAKTIAKNAKAAGLGVIISLHKNAHYSVPGYKTDSYVRFWSDFAGRLAETDPEYTFFEIINEPVADYRPGEPLYSIDNWLIPQEKIANAIREAAPDHTIVLCSSQCMRDTTRMGGDSDVNWDNVDVLVTAFDRLPEGLDNIIVTIHYYQPMAFTHQGQDVNFFSEIRGVSYPAEEGNVSLVKQRVSHPYAEQCLEDYLWKWSERTHFEQQMKRVALWRREHNNIYVYMGEFGACGSASQGRDRYFKDFSDAMAKYNIGWAHWCQSFGPNPSWVGLDKALEPYDPDYTGLKEVSVDYSIKNGCNDEPLRGMVSCNGKHSVGVSELFDLQGRLCGKNSIVISREILSEGKYFLRYRSDGMTDGGGLVPMIAR
jgi:hypothetical protein